MSAGIDIRQAIQDAGGVKVTQLIVEALQNDSSGDILATGTTQLELLKLLADGTLQVYDFDAGVRDFVASSPTDRDLEMTHRQAAGANTGIWTAVLDQHAVNAMDLRGIYYLRVTNTGASPKTQVRKFQFGGMDGDGFAFSQIAAADGADAYGTSIEANSVARAADIQDGITQVPADTVAAVLADADLGSTGLVADMSALRERLIRLRATVTSVVIPGQTYGVSLSIGSSTIATLNDHVAFIHSSTGAYKSGPHTMGNSGNENVLTVFGTAVAGDVITVARPLPTLTEIVAGTAIDADGYTLEEAMRLVLAVLCGTGPGSTASAIFRAVDDSKARVTATVTAAGDRTAITLDAT